MSFRARNRRLGDPRCRDNGEEDAQSASGQKRRRLDPKKAGVVLYGMQVALSNLDRLSKENTERQTQQSSSSVAAPPADIPTAPDVSDSTPSGKPDRQPPGTIQASAQPRRRADRMKVV